MSELKIKVGIAGAAGYTGGELIRILLQHPNAELYFVHSKSNSGKFLYSVHPDLLGETERIFDEELKEDIDVLFLCLGHGESIRFLQEHKIDLNVKVIDLSQDFRLISGEENERVGRKFVYGLPELNREQLEKTTGIANPGCFATAIQLALLPFASRGLLKSDIHISGLTGSTGAGHSHSETNHFSWRNSNVSAYKIMKHQHLAEILQSLKFLQEDFNRNVYFIPYRGNFTRGIMTTSYFQCDLPQEDAIKLVSDFYENKPFVVLSKTNPSLKQAVNSNKCILYLEKHNDTMVVISIIDNLLKGASGQAVQNMNIMFGLEETTGLKFKTVNF